MRALSVMGCGLLPTLFSVPVLAQAPAETIRPGVFITSTSLDGGNLGGLAGADTHCAALADAADLPSRTWRAYLSTKQENARDRIGSGPWHNVQGTLVARHLDDLHFSNMQFTKANVLNERGNVMKGGGDDPNEHDILTGSNGDGTFSGNSCEDWTSNSPDVRATVGHFDRAGGGYNPQSWNAAHLSLGCSLEKLRESDGQGHFYCFAAD